MKHPILLRAAALAVLVPASAAAQDAAGPVGTAANAPTEIAIPAPEDVLLLRLRDGATRWGAIAEHDPDGLRFVLLEHGGLVRVPWSLLDPNQARDLRTEFGYVEVATEELLIDVERLALRDGGEVTGVILSREGDTFMVKTGGHLQLVPKARVASIEKGVRVPALDVYSQDELYTMHAAQADPESARAQWDLARTCERILDFAHAVQHYEAAAELDPDFKADELPNVLARARVKAEQQEQIEYLRAADRARKKGKFDDAIATLEAFELAYPGSALAEDARKQLARTLVARDEAAKDYVAKRWKFWMRRLTREAASIESHVAALTYADEQLSQDILDRVVADVQNRITETAQAEEVRELWEQRKKVRYESTTYGNGTWLLGEEEAKAGNEAASGSGGDGPVNQADAERKALEEKIKRFLENQRLANRGRAAQEEEDLRESFWSSWSRSGRSMWLLAYYAENSGDLEVRPRPDLRACRTCAGRGALEIILTGGGGEGGGGHTLQKCPTCHGVQVVRRVHFR